MAIGFNTGRLYQADGQRISVGLSSNGEVLFQDHSRGIFGALEVKTVQDVRLIRDSLAVLAGHNILGRDQLRDVVATVMWYYDRNQYRYHPEADKITADDWPTVRI